MNRNRDTSDLFDEGRRERSRFGDNELRDDDNKVTKSDLVNVTLILRQDRPLALMVHRPEQVRSDPWISLPKSQITYEVVQPGCVVVSLPEWLAKDKGLV